MPNERQLQETRRLLGRIIGRQVTLTMAVVKKVDTDTRTVDVQPEAMDTVWKGVIYQPVLRDDEDGAVFDPDEGAWVLVATDRQGRRRILGPPSSWQSAHIVSSTAKCRVDITVKSLKAVVADKSHAEITGGKIEARLQDGASVVLEGQQVTVNDGKHPAARGDLLKNWLIAAVPSGPSGPLTPSYPDSINNPNVKID
jgi:hypothetical protein